MRENAGAGSGERGRAECACGSGTRPSGARVRFGNVAARGARAVRERDSAGRRFNVKRTRCRQNVQSALMPLVPARQRVKSETRSYSAVPMRAKHSHTFPHCNTSFPRTLALLLMSAGRRAHQRAQNRKRVLMRSP